MHLILILLALYNEEENKYWNQMHLTACSYAFAVTITYLHYVFQANFAQILFSLSPSQARLLLDPGSASLYCMSWMYLSNLVIMRVNMIISYMIASC